MNWAEIIRIVLLDLKIFQVFVLIVSFIYSFYSFWNDNLTFSRYVPESPRWLINKSKYKEALKVMEEIIGYVPNEILFEDEGSETPFSCRIFWDMLRYLRKRKIKIVLILTTMSAIIGFVYKIQGKIFISSVISTFSSISVI